MIKKTALAMVLSTLNVTSTVGLASIINRRHPQSTFKSSILSLVVAAESFERKRMILQSSRLVR